MVPVDLGRPLALHRRRPRRARRRGRARPSRSRLGCRTRRPLAPARPPRPRASTRRSTRPLLRLRLLRPTPRATILRRRLSPGRGEVREGPWEACQRGRRRARAVCGSQTRRGRRRLEEQHQTIAPSSLPQDRDTTTDLNLGGRFPARQARRQDSSSWGRLVVLTARSSVSLKSTVQHRARSLTRQRAHSGWTLELVVCSFVFDSSHSSPWSSPWYKTSPARFTWSLQHPHLDDLESPFRRSTLL